MKLFTVYAYLILGLLAIETGCRHAHKAHAQPVIVSDALYFGPSELISSTVAIRCGDHQGSGVLVRKGDTLFVWTAAHVVVDLADAPVLVFQEVVQDGKVSDQTICSVDLVYIDPVADLALFSLANPPEGWSGTRFVEGVVPAGVPISHVGNFLGVAPGSYSTGVISAVGRMSNLGEGAVGPMDQISCVAFPGSSGGGIFRFADGACVGIVVRQYHSGFSFMIPARVIREWAKQHNLEFAL